MPQTTLALQARAFIYQAPKPRYSGFTWFKVIAARIIFPPVLLWDLIKLGANKWLGRWVGGLILQAQECKHYVPAVTNETVSYYNEPQLSCAKYKVITHDRVLLDTLEIVHQSQANKAPEHQKYIIHLTGNATCYEEIMHKMKEDAKALCTNVVGFNFRGVRSSTGRAKSTDDLVIDGIAQVQRLLDRGVSPKNIILKGHSLGGGVASLVAKHFHQLKQPIKIFNDRSFSTITNVVVGQIRGPERPGRIILGWLANPFIKLALALVKWEINAGSAFRRIPEAYREYIVVRSRKALRSQYPDDRVIRHYASIHEALTSERSARKKTIDKALKRTDDVISRTDPCQDRQALLDKRAALAQARKTMKDRKMETRDPYANGHCVSLDSLHSRSEKSANTFFREFVERVPEEYSACGYQRSAQASA